MTHAVIVVLVQVAEPVGSLDRRILASAWYGHLYRALFNRHEALAQFFDLPDLFGQRLVLSLEGERLGGAGHIGKGIATFDGVLERSLNVDAQLVGQEGLLEQFLLNEGFEAIVVCASAQACFERGFGNECPAAKVHFEFENFFIFLTDGLCLEVSDFGEDVRKVLLLRPADQHLEHVPESLVLLQSLSLHLGPLLGQHPFKETGARAFKLLRAVT